MAENDADLVARLLDYLWLQERLSRNTLDAYRRDLGKVSARLAAAGLDFFRADGVALAAAVYVGNEQPL